MNPASEAARPLRQRPTWRWWIAPLSIILVGTITVTILRTVPDWENGTRMIATVITTAVFVGIYSLWFIFFSGADRALRWAVGLIELSLFGLFRLDGYSGDLEPKLVWRWSPKAHESLTVPVAPSQSGAAAVDLARTTPHDFPQFLGPTRNGHVSGVELAHDWRPAPRELWRQPIGAGWSSFAIVGDYALTMEQRGEDELTVCYEARTGRARWTHANREAFTSVMGGDGPCATPTIDQGRVYVMGGNGRLDCLDGSNGKRLWTQDTVKDTNAPLPTWGISGSPLIIENLVVVSPGGPDGHSLEAFDKASGKLVWHAGDSPASYASPLLATLAGRRQIVIVNRYDCSAHDPATGQILWRFDWPGDQPKVPQPVAVGENRLLLSAGYGVGAKLLEIVPSDTQSGRKAGEANSADEPGEETFEFATRVVWSSRALKPKFDNPMVRDGFIYGIDDGMALTCLDLETGKRVWRGGRYGHGQLLLVGRLLLVQTELGDVALVDAKPGEYHEYTWFHAIGERAWNTPALAGKLLLVRNHLEAAAFELP